MNESLLTRVAAGDDTAMAVCVDKYANLVWSLARRFLSSPTDAEDAVQEIFIDLWSSAARYDSSKASETTFVAMVARRRLIDRLRKIKRAPTTEQLDTTTEIDDPVSSRNVEIQDEAALAARLIKTLKPEQQQIIKLAVYHGHTHQSIAEAMGLPLGTVKTHLHRGLLRIRDAMQASTPASGTER